MVALTTILKDMVYPMLGLFEHVLKRQKVVPVVFEDNEATQKIVRSGKVDKAMGHVGRTHEIQVPWTADQFKAGNFVLRDCHTKAMAADVFTKYFVDPGAWSHALTLLSIFPQVKYEKLRFGGFPSNGAKSAPALAEVPPFPIGPEADGQAMGGVSSSAKAQKRRDKRQQRNATALPCIPQHKSCGKITKKTLGGCQTFSTSRFHLLCFS